MREHRESRYLQRAPVPTTRAKQATPRPHHALPYGRNTLHRLRQLLAAIVLVVTPFFGARGAAEPALSRQILIEANIWEITEAANIDYGVIWDLVDMDEAVNDLLDSSIFLPGFLTGANGQLGNPVGAFVQTTLDILRDEKMRYHPERGWIMTDLVAQLNTMLQAATRDGTVHLRANPKVVVVEDQKAVIHAGDKFPVVELTVTAQGLPTFKTTYHDTGVKLTVWPKIFRDEFVILSVRPEVTDITGFVEEDVPPSVAGEPPRLFRLPVLSTRDAYSQMIIRSGGTVIMSGLLLESQREIIREVPIVSKIPFLGWLFRSRNWTRQKNDILIEITPTILQAGESRYTPNGLIYEGEIFRSDSDIIRQLRQAERLPPEEVPGPPRAEEWFGVTPEEAAPEGTPGEETPPTDEAPTETSPDASGPETSGATPEASGS